MSTHADDQSVWADLDALSDDELQMLLASAVSVLESDGDADTNVSQMPESVLARELRDALLADGVATDRDPAALRAEIASSRPLSIGLLRELSAQPELAAEIGATYHARRQMMVIDPITLGAGALLLLVIKLKRVKVGDTEIEFYEAKGNALGQVRSFLGI